MLEFNLYYSITFWIAFLCTAFLYRVLGSFPKWRRHILFIASALFLLAIPNFHLIDLVIVLIVSVFSYLVSYILLKDGVLQRTLFRRLIAASGISLILLFLAFFKYHFFQHVILSALLKHSVSSLPNPSAFIFLIGVSYFSFKMMHVILESYKKNLFHLNIITYLNFIIFFPSFISGPINRYNHFSNQFIGMGRTKIKDDLKMGGERLIHGLFKKFVLAQIFFPYVLNKQGDLIGHLSIIKVGLGLYAYAFYFYFDFSGYSDLAIACARFLGIELPENFNGPFTKRNIRELWANWHMSLTSWLVDYIYWPLVRKLRKIVFFKIHPIILSNFCIIITFVICGMWHGEGLNFILWGAYHGIGIAIMNIYQREKKKIKSPLIKRYFISRYSRALGAFFTFNFFTLGLALFVFDIEKLKLLIKNVISVF